MVRRTRPKTKYHHGDLRAALKEAASTLLDIRGVEAISLRAIARRAGVSEAAPYKHFKSLDALLGEIVDEGFAMLAGDLELARDSEERSEVWRTFAMDYPGRYQLMFAKPGDRKSRTSRRRAIAALAEQVGGMEALAALHGQAVLEVSGLA